MNAMSQPNHPKKSPKFATLTALAAACTMMLSAPAIAATDTATAVTTSTAPNAIDSSKRVIRRATSDSTTSDSTASDTASTVDPVNNVSQPVEFISGIPIATTTAFSASMEAPRVYPPTPISNKAVSSTRPTNSTANNSAGTNVSRGQLPGSPIPQARVSDISFVPTVLIAQKQRGTEQLDVSLLDDFIENVSPNARHYPPNFPNRTQRYYTREKIKTFADWIDPYARAPDASFDVLLRAAKINGMGRNLDLGSDFAIRGGQYIDRAIKNDPKSGEANFLYGLMLSEGGGFKEGKKYLDRAVALGYTEAEQSLAQSDLLSDRRNEALDRLRRLEQKVPDNSIIRQQIKLIEEGKYYIWDLSAPNINVKPSI
ncbi:tetratricopeptide repeat protein [Psychrobacter urativorans]|uniref:tetratricopeptide repeat protein n=1 Tax=Psychrobacter urativorans TaxID=45610 RepID=UPI00191B5FED|nr:hypothetical protein [Psychrobacter urativorans]